jgi:hypothetical protein
MEAIQLIVFCMSTWRLTVMFLQDSGPFDIFDKLRSVTNAGVWEDANQIGRLLTCPYCFSVWAAIFMYALVTYAPSIGWPAAYILTASAVTSIIEDVR